ncbi:MAG: radical SAM protein [Bdellovibrionales bacterium]|jgi:organic radical activating enzyme|nr:radical SAM protein [Bdellovibrionales bacterium]MBT3525917.1 radical SAM protein [Bdellovibrionales bacterium]MBT7669137.1 radical SAM protein [Bdellovibrionales bacterium]MBT7765717.1 radical SAM protein [Bdellovibrionales bacterium]
MNKKLKWSNYDFSQIPFDQIVSFGQRSLLYQDLFCVSWLLGRFCNYKCSYCWTHGRSDQLDHRPTELCIKTMDEIKRQARERNYNSFHFSFSGGEPTLHRGYLDILKHYASDLDRVNFQSCHMTTNLSPQLKWFEKYIDATKSMHRISITASWHREYADQESFKEKIIFLQQHDVQVTINMVMVPESFNLIYDEALFFHDAGINVTLKPQTNSNATLVVENYTKEQLRVLHNGMPQRDFTAARLKDSDQSSERPKAKYDLRKMAIDRGDNDSIPQMMSVEFTDVRGKKYYMDQAERFNAFNFNHFEGWECDSGFRSIIIREPCGSIKRSYSCHDTPLGNIETGFKLFDAPRVCVTPTCVSSADSKIPKKRF